MYAGDEGQTDIVNGQKSGYHNFSAIVEEMKEVEIIEFGIGDIIRSGFARSYIIAKQNVGVKNN
jgi:phosphate starvation-inducible protein PhoH